MDINFIKKESRRKITPKFRFIVKLKNSDFYVIDYSHYTVKPVYNDHPWKQNLWPLLTGGRCLKVTLDTKMVVAEDKWSLFGGGR